MSKVSEIGKTLKARMSRGDSLLGAFVPVPSPELVEIVAYSGFDFVVVDAEHGSLGPNEIVQMIRAAQAASLAVLVRVPHASKDHVLRALDSGADGVIIPQVDTETEALAAVAQCKYPPQGCRGAAFYTRAHRFTRDSGWNSLIRANQETIVAVIVESPQAMENLTAISQVSGVDFVIYGQSDMSVCIGEGAHNAIEMNKAYKKITSLIAVNKLCAGVSASDVQTARKHLAAGFQIVVTGLLPMLLAQAGTFVAEARQT